MSIRRGLQAVGQILRRRVHRQVQRHVEHSSRSGPDTITLFPSRSCTINVSSIQNVGHPTPSLASTASRAWRSTARLWPIITAEPANGRRVFPLLLGFVGLGFVSHNHDHGFQEGRDGGEDRNRADLEMTTRLIRVAFKDAGTLGQSPIFPTGIKDYAVSRAILAKGTEGVVYGAKHKEVRADTVNTDISSCKDASTEALVPGEEHHEERKDQDSELTLSSLNECTLAVKMMFNYNIDSKPNEIMMDFKAEELPLLLARGDFGNVPRKRSSGSSHPNIVQMHQVFVDKVMVPSLRDAMETFDMALPARLNSNGEGADTTLYIVMKRYQTTLQCYLADSCHLAERIAMVIVTQLLEGVGYLGEKGVFHQDLKSNNILVDFQEDEESPHVVIADFGCAITLNGRSLSQQVTKEEQNRRGNAALMAPELKQAHKQDFVCYHDFTKSDVWAVGAMTYEVCGQFNPFYCGIDSETYDVEKLPKLQTQSVGLKLVTTLLLQKNPMYRPTPFVAANILQLFLWEPSMASMIRMCGSQSSCDAELSLWLCKLYILHMSDNQLSPEQRTQHRLPSNKTDRDLLGIFLKRVDAVTLREATYHINMIPAVCGAFTPELERHCLSRWENENLFTEREPNYVVCNA